MLSKSTEIGCQIYDFIEELFPITRSITGKGVRETLDMIQEYIPIELCAEPSGKEVFDWVIPKEWNISDAYIKDMDGNKIVDFKKNNLHVLNYSNPVDKIVEFEELKDHIYTLPEHPDWIPYRTSYYGENWGFCMKHREFEKMSKDKYKVKIDSTLEAGKLNYGELLIEGNSDKEILFSTYICHPSMCNDNLTGPAVLTFLAKKLLKQNNLRYSYRFLFIPETIGSIAWLSENENKLKNIKGGLVATCLGDEGIAHYKKTRQRNSYTDKVAKKVLMDLDDEYKILDFFPSGSDERQYCSPGFNLPIGSIMKTPYGHFPEYHTSADNLDFVSSESLMSSFNNYLSFVNILEKNTTYKNTKPKCEPKLDQYGVYDKIGATTDSSMIKKSIMWLLNFSDGDNSLLDISIRAEIDFDHIYETSEILKDKGLLVEI